MSVSCHRFHVRSQNPESRYRPSPSLLVQVTATLCSDIMPRPKTDAGSRAASYGALMPYQRQVQRAIGHLSTVGAPTNSSISRAVTAQPTQSLETNERGESTTVLPRFSSTRLMLRERQRYLHG